MIKLLRNIGLYVFATALLWLLAPLGFVMAIVFITTYKPLSGQDFSKWEALADYFMSVALARDQLANVIMQVPFNLVFIK